ncbi:hypothetical protein ILUMI_20712 [Ignelater luminosus]|uniref:PiggyBac transposable element-derived protein domain-containing protein n=1 Tax=Ignelater luminosus TaxID=2038154 RepID=A0A8K0G218_IGNLU|nr:hypothetical protein ILUMI_20712 [Ignelater luminosus]
MYWNTSEDSDVPLLAKTMPRNSFEQILRCLHVNDNQKILTDNKDKAYKLRPMTNSLNQNFGVCHRSTKKLSVAERCYKLWCLGDENGYILKFELYQGKNEILEAESEEYNLGERVVLSLAKQY